MQADHRHFREEEEIHQRTGGKFEAKRLEGNQITLNPVGQSVHVLFIFKA